MVDDDSQSATLTPSATKSSMLLRQLKKSLVAGRYLELSVLSAIYEPHGPKRAPIVWGLVVLGDILNKSAEKLLLRVA